MENTIEFDKRHGGPWDRGLADSYSHRARKPHYFVGATYSSAEITEEDMTEAEIAAYHAGYYAGVQQQFMRSYDDCA